MEERSCKHCIKSKNNKCSLNLVYDEDCSFFVPICCNGICHGCIYKKQCDEGEKQD